MSIRDYLTPIFEAVESSKEMIDTNATSFDDMAMATNAPGAFSDSEITDAENLNNEASMSRSDNDSASTLACINHEENPLEKATTEITKEINNLVNISKPEEEMPVSVEVTKVVGDVEDDEENNKENHHEELLKSLFGESRFAKMVSAKLGNKSCEDFLKESFYAGPLDFVPDTRFNTSDVLNTLKTELGDDAAGIHVEKGVDPASENAYYVVTQVDKAKLPKQITVEDVVLELDGNTYYIDKLSKDFPVKK